MKKSIFFYVCFISLVFLSQSSNSNRIYTRTNTQHIYTSDAINSSQIYAIDVQRVGSSVQVESGRCKSIARSIDANHKTQIFQLSKGQNNEQSRQQKMYEKLTTLGEQENIIQEFEIIGNYLFAITTYGDGFFIPLDSKSQIQKIKTNFFDNNSKGTYVDYIVLKNHKDRVLIISTNNMVLCRPDNYACQKIEGYDKPQNFRGAQLYKDNQNEYIFIISSNSIIYYELTSNNKLKNKKELTKQFFGAKAISLRKIYKLQDNKLLILDDLFGLREISGVNGLSNFQPTVKVIYEQFGCYELIGQNYGVRLILACSSTNSYFILKLLKSKQYTEHHYQPLETIFLHQKLYQIDSIESIILSRMFSGVKLFWSSQTLGTPYPHFYRNAGKVFLHNAIQAKLKVVNGIKSLIISAQDQIYIYQLKTIEPYVICSSSKSVIEDYKLKYHHPCAKQSQLNQENICTTEQSINFQVWEHKQLKIGSVLIPFILALIGLTILVYFIYKKYQTYKNDVESARLKYHTEDIQFDT